MHERHSWSDREHQIKGLCIRQSPSAEQRRDFLRRTMATMRVAPRPEPAPMKAAQISRPGGDFEIIEREIPKPGANEVRIKVQACGVCHSDIFVKEGLWPGIQY